MIRPSTKTLYHILALTEIFFAQGFSDGRVVEKRVKAVQLGSEHGEFPPDDGREARFVCGRNCRGIAFGDASGNIIGETDSILEFSRPRVRHSHVGGLLWATSKEEVCLMKRSTQIRRDAEEEEVVEPYVPCFVKN